MATGTCFIILRYIYSPLLSVPIFRSSLFSRRLSTGRLGRDQKGPIRAAIETRNKGGGSTGTYVSCYFLFSALFISSSCSSSFPLSTVQQQAELGGT